MSWVNVVDIPTAIEAVDSNIPTALIGDISIPLVRLGIHTTTTACRLIASANENKWKTNKKVKKNTKKNKQIKLKKHEQMKILFF